MTPRPLPQHLSHYRVQVRMPGGWEHECTIAGRSVAEIRAHSIASAGRETRVVEVGRLDTRVIATYPATALTGNEAS